MFPANADFSMAHLAAEVPDGRTYITLEAGQSSADQGRSSEKNASVGHHLLGGESAKGNASGCQDNPRDTYTTGERTRLEGQGGM